MPTPAPAGPRRLAAQAVPILVVAVVLLALLPSAGAAPAAQPGGAPTAEEARAFLDRTEARLLELGIAAERAAWVQATYITDDTELISAEAQKHLLAAQMEAAKEAARFRDTKLPADMARKIHLLRTSLSLAAPADPAKQ